MDPFQKFSEVLRIMRFSSQIVGRDIFGEKLRSGKIFYTLLLFIIIGMLACCYTMKYHDQNRAFAAAICLFGFSQSGIKYLTLADLRSLAELLNSISTDYKQNSNRNARDHDLYNRFAKFTQIILRAIIAAYLAADVFYQLPKLYNYFVTGVLEATAGIYLPMIDGFEVVTVVAMHFLNIVAILVASYIAYLFESITFVVFANMMIFPTVIKRDLEDLKLVLETRDSTRDEITSRLLKVMQGHMTLKDNIEKLDYGFRRGCLCQIGLASLFAVDSIFLIVKCDLTEAYITLVLGVLQVMTFCFFGTLVQIATDQVRDDISAFEWYLLPLDQRKAYRFFLQHVQQEHVIYIAKVKPLNMETSLAILKTIYSYGAMLNSSM